MRLLIPSKIPCVFRWMAIVAILIIPQVMQATQWHVTVGAQSKDKGHQALAFLPNEIWIHAGDSITWTFPVPEPHSVTFLTPGQVRPSVVIGCPGATADDSPFDGSACVNSGRIAVVGVVYTVTFPKAGNYRLVCLVHINMTGIVHVLDSSVPLPHDQDFYNAQAADQQRDLLSDHDRGLARELKDDADDPGWTNRGVAQLGCYRPHHHLRSGAGKRHAANPAVGQCIRRSRWRTPRHHQLNRRQRTLWVHCASGARTQWSAAGACASGAGAAAGGRDPVSGDIQDSRTIPLHMRLSRRIRHEG